MAIGSAAPPPGALPTVDVLGLVMSVGRLAVGLLMLVQGFFVKDILEHPLGVGGVSLMEWFFNTRTWRQMRGQAGGETGVDDESWKGWWGGRAAVSHARVHPSALMSPIVAPTFTFAGSRSR